MYIIKNSVKNIIRNKGRNGLMAVIILAIILATAVSIIINTTTAAIIKDYKARFGAEVSINPDSKMLQDKEIANSFRMLTPEQQIKFGESDLLQSSELIANIDISPRKLKSLDESERDSWFASMLSGQIKADGTKMPEIVSIKGKIVASNNLSTNEEFKNGLREITSGKMYKELNECIVSEKYAKLNNLSIGDTIEVDSFYKNKPMTHELIITGIYMDNTMLGKENAEKSAIENRSNEILTSFDTAKTMEMFKEMAQVSAKYILKDPEQLSTYEKELRQKGLAAYYKVSSDEEGYRKIVGPVEGLAKITNTFLIVVLILGSIILILLSTLAIRERKYEIGVLRAMGMKKGKVAFGFLTEMLVITGVCLCLGMSTGAVASQPIANSLLSNQIKLSEENSQMNTGGQTTGRTGSMGINSDTEIKPLSELHVSLSKDAAMQIIMISLILAGISSVAGIMYITKYEPMKILSERN